jgi:hypothetical protein
MYWKTSIKNLLYIYVYIQALLTLFINNKFFPFYYIGFFIICVSFNPNTFILEYNIYSNSENIFFEDIKNNLLLNNIENQDSKNILLLKNIDEKLKSNSINNNYNDNIIFNNSYIKTKYPLQIWTDLILGKEKQYFPSYFKENTFFFKSSVLEQVPINLNWNIQQSNINTNIVFQTGIKGKITLTELKQIQGITDDNLILSTKEQYLLIEEKLQSFLLERNNKIFIINNINKGTELWYPLNSGKEMQRTITEIIDPAIQNLLEMKNNILQEM